MEELGLAPLTGFAAALAAGTVAGIDALKIYVLRGWAKRVPSIVWYLLAIGVPTAICVYFGLDWFNALTGDEVPESLQSVSTAATGIMVGLGASISYKGKETAKALAAAKLQAESKPVPEYLTPPGEPGIPAPAPCDVSQNGDVSESGNTSQSGNVTTQIGNLPQNGQEPTIYEVVQGKSTTQVCDSQTNPPVPTQFVAESATNPAEMTSDVINEVSPQADDTVHIPHQPSTTSEDSITSASRLVDQSTALEPLEVTRGNFVVLGKDGLLYGLRDGEIVHLPGGWQTTTPIDV